MKQAFLIRCILNNGVHNIWAKNRKYNLTRYRVSEWVVGKKKCLKFPSLSVSAETEIRKRNARSRDKWKLCMRRDIFKYSNFKAEEFLCAVHVRYNTQPLRLLSNLVSNSFIPYIIYLAQVKRLDKEISHKLIHNVHRSRTPDPDAWPQCALHTVCQPHYYLFVIIKWLPTSYIPI